MNRWFSHCYRVLATPNIYQPYLQYTVRILSMPLSKLFSFLVSFQQTNAKCTSIISILSIIKNADKASHRPARHGGQILFASTHVGNMFVMLLRSSRFLNKGMESPYIVPQMDQFTMGFTSSPSKAENFPKYINHQLEEIWFQNLQAWTKSFWASQIFKQNSCILCWNPCHLPIIFIKNRASQFLVPLCMPIPMVLSSSEKFLIKKFPFLTRFKHVTSISLHCKHSLFAARQLEAAMCKLWFLDSTHRVSTLSGIPLLCHGKSVDIMSGHTNNANCIAI